MNRFQATVVSLAVCGVVMSPVREGFRVKPHDDFPLSWYPMFAPPRPALEGFVYVVAVDADSTRHKVAQNFWTSGGLIQGARELAVAKYIGRPALEPLCARIGRNVGRSRREDLAQALEVWIVRGRYSREQYFGDGNHTPIWEKILQTCQIQRSPG